MLNFILGLICICAASVYAALDRLSMTVLFSSLFITVYIGDEIRELRKDIKKGGHDVL